MIQLAVLYVFWTSSSPYGVVLFLKGNKVGLGMERGMCHLRDSHLENKQSQTCIKLSPVGSGAVTAQYRFHKIGVL